jgi:hypothetical protein
MQCELQHGECINCGGGGFVDCKAEAPLQEIIDMHLGKVPARCIRITSHQIKRLREMSGVPTTQGSNCASC